MRKHAITSALVAAVSTIALALPATGYGFDSIGEFAPSSTGAFSCGQCSYFQSADDGATTYAVPNSGVITQFAVRTGTTVTAGDTVQLQAYRSVGPNKVLIGASEVYSLAPSMGNLALQLGSRISVQAGDRIGLRINTTGGGGSNTTGVFATGSASFKIFQVFGVPNIGDTVSGGESSSLKLNAAAVVEADADGDGFGDESQDLCLGDSAHGDTACTGQLLGSRLGHPGNSGNSCGVDPCDVVQTSISGATLTAPANGVLLRWRVKGPSSGIEYRLRTLRDEGGGNLRVINTSSSGITSPGDSQKIYSAATRIGVKAGDRIALRVPGGAQFMTWSYPGSGRYALVNPSPADGAAGALGGESSDQFQALFNADFEPDADGDLWGDVSEDGCPTDATRKDDCIVPGVTGFGLTNKRFVIDAKGAVVSAKTPKGTTAKLMVNESATAKFTVERAEIGRKVGSLCRKKSRSNAKRKKCTRYVKVHSFSRTIGAGSHAIPYSGRYKLKGRTKTLPAGDYRLAAIVYDANGNTATVSPAKFTVARSKGGKK